MRHARQCVLASDRYDTCMRLGCGETWNARLADGLSRLGVLATEAVERAR